MISVSDALQLVKSNSSPISQIKRKVKDSAFFCLAEDVEAAIDLPPFRQSAMDGYALNMHGENNYMVKGEIKAGDRLSFQVLPGEAVRIFTGGAVPDSADTVVRQEDVVEKKGSIYVQSVLKRGSNIRPRGEQLKEGELALSAGTYLTPATLGFISALGITELKVYKKPTIAVVSTGSELVEPGRSLSYGKVYESNAIMLSSALRGLGYHEVEMFKEDDKIKAISDLLGSLINDFDVVVVTGGISVGEYDYVGKALDQLGVNNFFEKVRQKPGKPLYFGKKDNTAVFGLPGNPAAALICFYIYVRTCLELLSGNKNYQLDTLQAISDSSFTKRGNNPQFCKAFFKGNSVEILEGQSSSMLRSFAMANALVYIPGEVREVNPGDRVEVIVLPV